jgi:hypothetical protein
MGHSTVALTLTARSPAFVPAAPGDLPDVDRPVVYRRDARFRFPIRAIESATLEESYDVPPQTQPQFARAAR